MWGNFQWCLVLLLTAGVASEETTSNCDAGDFQQVIPGVGEEMDAKNTSLLQLKSKAKQARTVLVDEETNQINGGSEVSQEEVDAKFPWFVQFINMKSCTSFCGGALVAPGTILTAAHCFFDEEEGQSGYVDADHVRVLIGYAGPVNTDPDFQGECRYPSEGVNWLRKIGAIHKPVHYGIFKGFDIGLVHLKSESCMLEDEYVAEPVKMAGLMSEFYYSEHKWRLLGYGATKGETGAMSEYLKTLEAPVQAIGNADGDCNYDDDPVADGVGNPRRPMIICSPEKPGIEQGAGGDSGGPWTVPFRSGKSILVGVQSSGVTNLANEAYGFLVSVPWFQNWIASAIWNDDKCIPRHYTKSEIQSLYFDGFDETFDEANKNQYCKYEDCHKCSNEKLFVVGKDPDPDTCFNDGNCPVIKGCVGFADE